MLANRIAVQNRSELSETTDELAYFSDHSACFPVPARTGRSAAGVSIHRSRQRIRRARAEAKPILLYFGRYGCAWCDHVNRKTFSDPGLKQLFSENYVLIYVDAEGGKRSACRPASG